MLDLSLTIDPASLLKKKQHLTVLALGGLPELEKAVEQATKFVRNEWVRMAMGTFKHSTGGYLKGIQVIYPADDGFSGMVINSSGHARLMENGWGSFDMKKMLYTSHQARMNKKGERYLIIPFRHLTPGEFEKGGMSEQRATGQSMPQNVYNTASALAMSKIKGTYYQASVNLASKAQARKTIEGQPQAQHWRYKWAKEGGRLKGVGGIYEGMVRFRTTGGGSRYLTFRVMTEKSSGWIHPGHPGYFICKRTAESVKGKVETYLRHAFEQDIKNIQAS